MIWILYLLSLVLIFHDCLLILGLSRINQHNKHTFSLIIATAMIAMAILSIAFQSWAILTFSYAVYRLLIMVDMIAPAIRAHRPPSPLLPVNLLIVSGAMLAYFFHWWLVFVGSYVIFWSLSLLVAKRWRENM
jgi:hypothetical protein